MTTPSSEQVLLSNICMMQSTSQAMNLVSPDVAGVRGAPASIVASIGVGDVQAASATPGRSEARGLPKPLSERQARRGRGLLQKCRSAVGAYRRGHVKVRRRHFA